MRRLRYNPQLSETLKATRFELWETWKMLTKAVMFIGVYWIKNLLRLMSVFAVWDFDLIYLLERLQDQSHKIYCELSFLSLVSLYGWFMFKAHLSLFLLHHPTLSRKLSFFIMSVRISFEACIWHELDRKCLKLKNFFLSHHFRMKVAWIHIDRQMILTIHRHVISRIPRYSVTYDNSNTWLLHVNQAQQEDRG